MAARKKTVPGNPVVNAENVIKDTRVTDQGSVVVGPADYASQLPGKPGVLNALAGEAVPIPDGMSKRAYRKAHGVRLYGDKAPKARDPFVLKPKAK